MDEAFEEPEPPDKLAKNNRAQVPIHYGPQILHHITSYLPRLLKASRHLLAEIFGVGTLFL